jgi:carboxyl-terminal processing protease
LAGVACTTQRIPPAPLATRTPTGEPVGAIDFSVFESAYNLLLNRAVERPAPPALLDAAWDGLLAEAKQEGVNTAGVPRPAFARDRNAGLQSFEDAFSRLTARHGASIDAVKLNYAAAAAMADSLGDSHTTFLPPDLFAIQNKREAGNLGTTTGIRMERVTDRPPLVLEVVPGSAADRAGLQAGDSVLAIDGRKIGSFTPREASRALDGPDGSTLTLDVRRPGRADRRITITRQTMALDLVRSTQLPGNIGYIRIREFPATVPFQLQVKQALGDFDDTHTNGVIVDLRGNPGGSLDDLREVLSLFVSQSPLSYLVGAGSSRTMPIARASGRFTFDQKLVVLVDGGSASSSEMFAAAVQQYHDGLIVGAKTCGCLMAAQFFPLADRKAGLEVAVEGVLSPVSQQTVEKVGVTPDREVEPDARALAEGRDPQLEAALQALGVDAALARNANKTLLQAGP